MMSQEVQLQQRGVLGESSSQRVLRIFGITTAVGLAAFYFYFPFAWTGSMSDAPKIFASALQR